MHRLGRVSGRLRASDLDGVTASMPASSNGHSSGHSTAPGLSALTDRLPPQNIEAELGVLGGVLLDNDMLHDVMPILTPEDFYRETHQTIFRAIRDLYERSKAVDAIILTEELTSPGPLRPNRRRRHA